jgi:hypothetical protein
MRHLLTILVALAVAAACAVAIIQKRRSTTVQQTVSGLETKLEETARQLEETELARQQVDQQRTQLLQLTEDMGKELKKASVAVEAAQQKVTSAPPAETASSPATEAPKQNLGTALAKMMEDPETRKFIRNQQRMMMDQMYGPLVRQLGMNDADAGKFKDFLADKMMAVSQKATAALSGGSQGNRAEVFAQLKTDQEQFDNELKEFLGEQNHAVFTDYQRTVGERVQLNMFRQQTAGSANTIDDDQAEQLLALIKEEKERLPGPDGTPGGFSQEQAQQQAFGSPEQAEKLVKVQQDLNERVYARAQSMLSPGQLEAFSKFQEQQTQMLKMSLSMAQKMFAPEETAPGEAGQ